METYEYISTGKQQEATNVIDSPYLKKTQKFISRKSIFVDSTFSVSTLFLFPTTLNGSFSQQIDFFCLLFPLLLSLRNFSREYFKLIVWGNFL